MANKLTHLDEQGQAIMVDISDKGVTPRVAVASARLTTQTEVLALLERAANKKGDVFATARVAGIMAAKRTSDLIPLCHPLALTKATIEFQIHAAEYAIDVTATCAVEGKTGVEMEALTAASVAALALYDMCKAVDPAMVIGDIKLLEKTGGKRGVWQREGGKRD